MNHLSNINQIGQYEEIKADLDLVLSEFYEYKWYQKVSISRLSPPHIISHSPVLLSPPSPYLSIFIC